MNKEEFVKYCKLSGYCDEKTAEKYAAGKEKFSEQDFEEVFRLHERRMAANIYNMPQHATHIMRNGKTSKRYKNISSDS